MLFQEFFSLYEHLLFARVSSVLYLMFCCICLGCPVQVSRRSLEAHLCVCEYSSRVCASGCGYTILNNEEAQHNCVSELRAELDMLRYKHSAQVIWIWPCKCCKVRKMCVYVYYRAELDCKVEEVRHEMESRLDSQRRHMVQKESLLRSEVDELKVWYFSNQQAFYVCGRLLTSVCLCEGSTVPCHVRCPHPTGCRESTQTRAREGGAWEGGASWTFKKGGAQTSHSLWSCSSAPWWGAEKAKPTKPSFGLHQKEE